VPKLINFFNNGAFGSGQASFSSLLPLLSILPENVVFEADFYNKLLKAVWKGLKSEHVDAATNPWVVEAYIECITFYTIRSSRLGKPNVASDVMKEHFYPVLEAFFKYEQVISTSLAPASAQLVLRLSTRSECSRVSDEFWARFREMVSKFAILSADAPFAFQSTSADAQKQYTVSCSHLNAFLTELLKTEPTVTLRKSGTFVEVPDQVKNFIRELYDATAVAITNTYVPQVEILAALSKTVFSWDIEEAIAIVEQDVLPHAPAKEEDLISTSDETKDKARVAKLVIEVVSSFFAVSSLSPAGRRTWEALLTLWAKNTNLTAIKQVLDVRIFPFKIQSGVRSLTFFFFFFFFFFGIFFI
jgi:hypothetical protein